MSRVARAATADRPYPGLRPFDLTDAFLFFGREHHTQELLDRLARNRFLAVVGTSGSGKSSLVRAGVIPALYRGYLVGATSRWRIAVMRPGSAPLDEMARSLAPREALGLDAEQIREQIGASSLGLVSIVKSAKLAAGESLLLVVDQFEELFRFASESRSQDVTGEALLFVNSLLDAADQIEAPIYIVLTMRTDFLGDCTHFPGLAEALNRSQYLIPRLSRDQRGQAMERPVEVVDSLITPRLVQQLLNDMGDDPDQLPVMQHALARTYRLWKERGTDDPIDLADYERAGSMAGALNDHAQSIYDGLSPADQVLTRNLFRCLTKMEKGREVRRPARMGRLFAVAGASDEASRTAVRRVIDAYAGGENSLLVVSQGEDPIIDISHESLIRKWHLLSKWVKEEAESVAWYSDLMRDAVRQAKGEADYWVDPELKHALALQAQDGWTSAWAEQYCGSEPPGFDGVQKFLDKSRRKERLRKRTLTATLCILVLLLLTGAIAAMEFRGKQKAERTAGELSVELVKVNGTLKLEQDKRADTEQKVAQARDQLNHATDSQKKDIQATIDQLNVSIVGSLKQENTALLKKVADQEQLLRRVDTSKRPAYEEPAKDNSEFEGLKREKAASQETINGLNGRVATLTAQVSNLTGQLQKAEASLKEYQQNAAAPANGGDKGGRVAPLPSNSLPQAVEKPALIRTEVIKNSAVAVAGGKIMLLFGDLNGIALSANLYVLSGKPATNAVPEMFNDKPGAAAQVARFKMKCDGGGGTVDGYYVRCFNIDRSAARKEKGQLLGPVSGGGIYDLWAVGFENDKQPYSVRVELRPR